MEKLTRNATRAPGLSLTRLALQLAVALVGVLALWSASSAMASERAVWWNGKLAPLAEANAATWTGKLSVTDTKGINGTQTVECSDTAEGTVASGGAGEITKVTASACKGIVGCDKTELKTTVTALNLPWHTELALVEGAVRDVIVNGGKGTPGFQVACLVFGILSEDTCTGTLGTTTANAEGHVSASFRKSELLGCSQGGSGSGYAEGAQTITRTGGSLSAQHEAQPGWLENTKPLAEARNIAANGTFKFYDPTEGALGTFSAECKSETKGNANLGGLGSISSFKLTTCVPGAELNCESGTISIEALHLPWRTELFASQGLEQALYGPAEQMTSGGSGAPGFLFKCRKAGVLREDRCEGGEGRPPIFTTLENAENGVLEKFVQQASFHCSFDVSGSKGSIESSSKQLDQSANGEFVLGIS